MPNSVRWVATTILAEKKIKFAKQGQNQANGFSACSYWCPEFEDFFLFELDEYGWVMSQDAMPKYWHPQMWKFGRRDFWGLKIPGKNTEKCRKRRDLSKAHYWSTANWDIGDFVHFRLFFWPFIHILAVIDLEIDWELYFKPTYHIKLASLKNINVWTLYRLKLLNSVVAPISGHRVLALNSAIFVLYKKKISSYSGHQ